MNNLQPYRKNVLYNAPGENDFYASPSSPDGKDQLEQIIDLLHKQKWVILSVFLIVFAAFGAYAYLQTPEYQATSLVMISGDSPGSSSSAAAIPQISANVQWGRATSTELTLLRSSNELPRSVIDRVFAIDPDEHPGVEALRITETGDTLSRDEVMQNARSYISFEATGDGMIQFRAVTPSPHVAGLLANLYAEEYVALTRRVSRASLVASREFLENQLETQEGELRAVEQRVENYLSEKGAVSIEGEGSRLTGQVSQMEGRRDQIEIEKRRRQASLQAMQQNLEEIQPRLAQSVSSTVSQDIELVQQKIAELKATRHESLVRNPEWDPETQPELREVNRQIDRLEEEIAGLSEQYVNETVSAGGSADSTSSGGGMERAVALKQQIAGEQIAITGLDAELEALGEHLERYRAELKTIPGESIEVDQLRRERDRIEESHAFISRRLQEVRLTEQGELGYASVVTQASVGTPVQPQQERTLILGAFFGLLLGLGVALLRSKFDNRLFKPDQVEARGYNVTIVPDMKELLETEHEGKALIERDGRQVASSLVTLHTSTSYATEAYRQLRTNVQYSLSDRASNVIVVTSAGVGEGKSTTAANLAVAFARTGSRTLLIDADMRRPQIHGFFGLSLEPGLHQLLQGRLEVAPEDMESGVPNLSVVTAGKVSGGDASELVSSSRMQELLAAVRERFDVVLIDTPPTLAVAEAKILSPKANATLLVTRAGMTKEKELDHTVHELERVGGQVLGVVLNGFNIDMAYGYHYRYRHYSDYGQYAQYAQQ